jgi:hypothetical protein
MNAVAAHRRGIASGTRATFQNAGMVLSIGVFFLMFAALLGGSPIASLLSTAGVLHQLPQSTVDTLTGRTVLPSSLTAPFHSGLPIVFILAARCSPGPARPYRFSVAESTSTTRPQPTKSDGEHVLIVE